MLPKNNLRDARMRKLRVFPGPDHPFRGVELVTWVMPPRKLQDKGLGWLMPQGFEPMNPEAYMKRMQGSKQLLQQQQQLMSTGSCSAANDSSSSNSSNSSNSISLTGFEDLLTAEEVVFVRSSTPQHSK